MSISTSRSQAQDFRNRWKLVNDAERRELRSTPISMKARQLEVMMAAARELNWLPALAVKEDETHQVWQKLRERYQQTTHEKVARR